MYGPGAGVHVGICARFLKGIQFSRIQKTSTARKDLQGFLDTEEN